MNKKIIAAIVASVIALPTIGVSIVHAKEGHHRAEKRMEHLIEKLDLTEQQQTELRESMGDRKEQMRSAMESRKELRKEIRNLDPNAADYDQKLNKLVAEAEKQAKEMVLNKAEKRAQLYAVLTPEQEQKFEALQDKWQKKMHDRMGDGEWKKGKHCR